MRRNYSLVPSMIQSSPGIIWSFNNPYEIFHFNESHPLHVSNQICNDTSFCLWYSSPIFYFNDSLLTQYAFMGELNKWTFISQQRFSHLTINFNSTLNAVLITWKSRDHI